MSVPVTNSTLKFRLREEFLKYEPVVNVKFGNFVDGNSASVGWAAV